MTTESNIPARVSYTRDDLARMNAKKVYNEGWYAFYITNGGNAVNGTGSLRLDVSLVPLADPTDIDSRGTIKLNHRITLPIDNPNKSLGKDKIPKTQRVVRGFFEAFGGKLSDGLVGSPRKIDGTLMFKGEPLDKNDYQAAAIEADDTLMQKICAVWEDPTMMVGHIAYGKVELENGYPRVVVFKSELPSGEELVPSEEWFA